jgi:hypothetical protein
MGGTRVLRRWLNGASALLLGATLLSACATKADTVNGIVPRPPILGVVTFDQYAAVARNGLLQAPPVASVCGSDKTTFGTELTTTSPDKAKVNFEWGQLGEDVVAEQHIISRARAAGATDLAWSGISEPKRVSVSGTVRTVQLSSGDLTFNHPFGVDYTMNLKLDPAYSKAALLLGTPIPNSAVSTLHVEIQQGLLPHSGTKLQDFMPGYAPQEGDRIAAYGPWIIDCGHDNYQSELHELTFLAFGHQEGNATVSHAFYNPYRQSGLLAGRGDLTNYAYWARFNDPTVKPFPPFLVSELLRVGHLKEPFHDRIEAHQMMKASYEPPVPWYVCAPGKGSTLSYSYHFTVRSGVSISVAPDTSTGCVKFTATIGGAYQPLTPIRKDCIDPWSQLNAQIQAALGDPTIDVKKLIEAQVPASFVPNVEHDPLVDCYDPLTVGAPGGSGDRSVVTLDSQPFPFYGDASVSWAS